MNALASLRAFRGVLLSIFLLPAAAGAQEATHRDPSSPAPLARSEFLRPTLLHAVRLSPDGQRVAFLRGELGKRGLWLQSLHETAAQRVLPQVDASDLIWSRDGQWLFLVASAQLSVYRLDGQGGTGRIARLNEQVSHEAIGADPSQPAAILLLEHTRPGAAKPRARLLRIAAAGQQQVLYEDALPLGDAVLSADGKLAFLRRIEREQHLILRLRLGQAPMEVARCVNLERCQFVSVADDGSLWMLSNHAQNFSGLQRLKPDGQLELLHSDPQALADIDAVSSDPLTGEPLLAAYRSVVPQVYGLNVATQLTLERLQAQLPGRDLSVQMGHGAWLISERDSCLPQARWHAFDPKSGELRRLALMEETAPPQDCQNWVRKAAMHWKGSDGLRLHGFLSLPQTSDPRSLPLVVSVHGGPWSASGPGFSPITQFLVSRGYAVFEPNFRGSTGLGRAYLFAANGDFGNGLVLGDIVAGTRAVLAQGVGDAQRVAIQGASFGGYAALQAATFHPDVYQVAIAGVPPSDFGWALRWAITQSDLRDQIGTPLAIRFKLLGVDPHDSTVMQRLHTQSPLANATQLQRPVVIFAGGRDERVAIRSVTHYAARLRQLGKAVDLYVESDAGHGLEDSLSREAFLFILEQSLHTQLGGPAPLPASADLLAYLQRSQR